MTMTDTLLQVFKYQKHMAILRSLQKSKCFFLLAYYLLWTLDWKKYTLFKMRNHFCIITFSAFSVFSSVWDQMKYTPLYKLTINYE